jgi:hypothetical protein
MQNAIELQRSRELSQAMPKDMAHAFFQTAENFILN